MKLKKITIEGMHNVIRKTYDLSNLTYLFGKNGAGKSTVMQAIQLALLGYIPGTAKTKSELFRHANNHTMAITLVIDDNNNDITIRRIWTGTSSNITATVDITPTGYDVEEIIAELELPIFNFNEFIDMTANKLKDWFINFLPSAETKIDWEIALRENLVVTGVADIDDKFVKSCAAEISSYKLSGIDEIRKANDYFKTALSLKKKEVERFQSTIQSLVYYDDIDDVESEDEVRSKISEYQEKKLFREKQLESSKRYETIKKQLDEYSDCTSGSYETDVRVVLANDTIETAKDQKAELKEQIDACVDQKTDYIDKKDAERIAISKLNAKIDTLKEIINSKGICPFTSIECNSIKSLIEKYQEDIKNYTTEIEEHNKTIYKIDENIKQVDDTVSNLMKKSKSLDEMINSDSYKILDVKNRYSTYNRLKETIGEEPIVEEDNTNYDLLIHEQTDLLAKIGANKKYNELINTLTEDKYKVESEIICYNSWIKLTGVNGLQSDDSAAKPFIDLAGQMDKYIQTVFGESVKSEFNIESKANSFSFGIERNHKYIPFNLLSSGEKCLYTLALMISLVDNSKSPLKIVMVDDLFDHLDDINAEKLFESLQKVNDIQMIFAGVKNVSGDFVVEVSD